jgi:hypothetical protein
LRTREQRQGIAWTPNQVVASRIADARMIRGMTQEEAADALAPYIGARWSGATFSIVERSVDGKRIRQFTADDLLALSRAFDLPIGFFLSPPTVGDEGSLIDTPDSKGHGIPGQVLVDAVLGTDNNFHYWWEALAAWGVREGRVVAIDTRTGQVIDVTQPSPDPKPRFVDIARLRSEVAVAQQFGDLATTRETLGRLLAFLDHLATETEHEEPEARLKPPRKATRQADDLEALAGASAERGGDEGPTPREDAT